MKEMFDALRTTFRSVSEGLDFVSGRLWEYPQAVFAPTWLLRTRRLYYIRDVLAFVAIVKGGYGFSMVDVYPSDRHQAPTFTWNLLKIHARFPLMDWAESVLTDFGVDLAAEAPSWDANRLAASFRILRENPMCGTGDPVERDFDKLLQKYLPLGFVWQSPVPTNAYAYHGG